MSKFIALCISGTFNPKTISHWEFIFLFWQFWSSVDLSGTFSSLPSPAPPHSCLWSRRGLRTHEDWIWREKPRPHPLVISLANRRCLKLECVSSSNNQSQCISRPARKHRSTSHYLKHTQGLNLPHRDLIGKEFRRRWPTRGHDTRHGDSLEWRVYKTCNCSTTANALFQ